MTHRTRPPINHDRQGFGPDVDMDAPPPNVRGEVARRRAALLLSSMGQDAWRKQAIAAAVKPLAERNLARREIYREVRRVDGCSDATMDEIAAALAGIGRRLTPYLRDQRGAKAAAKKRRLRSV